MIFQSSLVPLSRFTLNNHQKCPKIGSDFGQLNKIDSIVIFFLNVFKDFISFFVTFSRLIASKSIRHDVRCANCKSQVIIGMRYQCLQCLNYDLCQHCFFYGFTSQNHKLSHPMQEYCYKSSRKEATRALLKLISNNLGLNRNSR